MLNLHFLNNVLTLTDFWLSCLGALYYFLSQTLNVFDIPVLTKIDMYTFHSVLYLASKSCTMYLIHICFAEA